MTRESVSPDGLPVLFCSVSFVGPESVLRRKRVNFGHIAVSRNLCKNGGGRNREDLPVSTHDSPLGERTIRETIHSVKGKQNSMIGEKGSRKGPDSPFHGEESRPPDIELLDFFHRGPPERGVKGVFRDPAGQRLPLFPGDRLRIADPESGESCDRRRKDDTGRRYGTRQGPSSDLVHPHDKTRGASDKILSDKVLPPSVGQSRFPADETTPPWPLSGGPPSPSCPEGSIAWRDGHVPSGHGQP